MCCLFTVNYSCSSKGALGAINKDPRPLEEAITRGDLSTAKKLLGITESETESGDLKLVGFHPLTWDVIQSHNFESCAIVQNTQLQEYFQEEEE